MKTRFILPVLFLISFSPGSFTSCKEPSSGPENEVKDSLVLKFKESDLTSATFSLHTSNVTLPATVSLYRNGDSVQAFLLHRADTTLKDSLLSPSTSYNWQAKLRKTASSFLTSNTVTARTTDTTSHSFTWKLDTLGASGSVLFDVAIVNDTCVWVVGDIKSQPYSPVDRYNAAMWNGKVWKKFKFSLPTWTNTTSVQILMCNWNDGTGIWIFSEIGAFIKISFDGKVSQIGKTLERKGTPAKIWGYQKDHFYLVGSDGSITHYNGSTFTLMESGTTVNLQDVWGTSDNEVWACGGSIFNNSGSVILKIRNGQVQKVWDYATSVFPDPRRHTLISSLWYAPNSGTWWEMGLNNEVYLEVNNTVTAWSTPIEWAPSRLRGSGDNSIFICAPSGRLCHFNGLTWKAYPELYRDNRDFYSLDVKPNRLVVVGKEFDGKALILTGI